MKIQKLQSKYTFYRLGSFVFLSEEHVDGLVHGCSNSSALQMEFLQTYPKPSMCVAMV